MAAGSGATDSSSPVVWRACPAFPWGATAAARTAAMRVFVSGYSRCRKGSAPISSRRSRGTRARTWTLRAASQKRPRARSRRGASRVRSCRWSIRRRARWSRAGRGVRPDTTMRGSPRSRRRSWRSAGLRRPASRDARSNRRASVPGRQAHSSCPHGRQFERPRRRRRRGRRRVRALRPGDGGPSSRAHPCGRDARERAAHHADGPGAGAARRLSGRRE